MKTKKAMQSPRETLMNRLGLAMRMLEAKHHKNDFMEEKSLLLKIKELAAQLISLPAATPQLASKNKIIRKLAKEIAKKVK